MPPARQRIHYVLAGSLEDARPYVAALRARGIERVHFANNTWILLGADPDNTAFVYGTRATEHPKATDILDRAHRLIALGAVVKRVTPEELAKHQPQDATAVQPGPAKAYGKIIDEMVSGIAQPIKAPHELKIPAGSLNLNTTPEKRDRPKAHVGTHPWFQDKTLGDTTTPKTGGPWPPGVAEEIAYAVADYIYGRPTPLRDELNKRGLLIVPKAMTSAEPCYKQFFLGGPRHGQRVRVQLAPEQDRIVIPDLKPVTFADLSADTSPVVENYQNTTYLRTECSVFGAVLTFWVAQEHWPERNKLAREFVLQPLEI